MSLFGMGKRPKHKNFAYKPRFYDKEADELNQRLSPYKNKKDGSSADDVKSRLRGSFKKPLAGSYETDHFKKQVKRSNRIVLYVTLILCAIVLYFLLVYMPSFVKMFE